MQCFYAQRKQMKTTVDGKEIYTMQELVTSDLPSNEMFNISIGELRRMHKRHCEALMELKTTQMDLEVAKAQIKEQKRFVVYA